MPSIFGTLFERALDASKRAQLGAHYTAAADIESASSIPSSSSPCAANGRPSNLMPKNCSNVKNALMPFQRWPPSATASAPSACLDPACGSGNFLYLALRSLLDLEKEVIDFAAGNTAGMARIH